MRLKLVPLNSKYLDLVRRWRNRDRHAFVDSAYISRPMQTRWFKKYTSDPAQKLYIIFQGKTPLGFIGLKLNPPDNPDFGPYLLGDKAYVRQGIMVWAIKEIMRLHPAPKYHGLVKKTNPAALALDQKVGFQIITEDARSWHVELDHKISPSRTSNPEPRTSFIPLLQPSCSPAEIQAVTKVLQSGWWGLGPVTKQLETEFAAYAGTRYAIAVNSATSALHLAIHVLKGTKTTGNLITTPLTFVSTAAVGLYENLEVRFADIDETTLCLDPQTVLPLIDENTLAVIPVHYAGYPAPIPYAHLPVIEDRAHAAATSPLPQTGILACWSFHPVKNIATGDGGMLTTNDAAIYQELLRLRWLGIDLDTWSRETKGYNWEYHIHSVGFKYHANDILSSIALTQLQRLPELNQKRATLAKRYLRALKNLPLTLPQNSPSWHLFVIRLHDPTLRPQFIEYLRDRFISVGVHYQPLHHYPIFNWHQSLPVTDRVYPTLVDLPIFPNLSFTDQDYIIATIKQFFSSIHHSP